MLKSPREEDSRRVGETIVGWVTGERCTDIEVDEETHLFQYGSQSVISDVKSPVHYVYSAIRAPPRVSSLRLVSFDRLSANLSRSTEHSTA